MARRMLRSEVWATEDLPTRARIARNATSTIPLAPSDCSAWGLEVFDTDVDGEVIYETSGAPSEVLASVYSTTGWDEDSTGGNFEHVLSPSDFTRVAGNVYRLEYSLSTSHLGIVPIVHLNRAKELWQ